MCFLQCLIDKTKYTFIWKFSSFDWDICHSSLQNNKMITFCYSCFLFFHFKTAFYDQLIFLIIHIEGPINRTVGFFFPFVFVFAFFSVSVVYLICLVLALPLPILSSSFRLSLSTLDKYVLNDWTSAALSGVSWRSVKDWESVPETHTRARPISKLHIVLSASFITGTVIGLKGEFMWKEII